MCAPARPRPSENGKKHLNNGGLALFFVVNLKLVTPLPNPSAPTRHSFCKVSLVMSGILERLILRWLYDELPQHVGPVQERDLSASAVDLAIIKFNLQIYLRRHDPDLSNSIGQAVDSFDLAAANDALQNLVASDLTQLCNTMGDDLPERLLYSSEYQNNRVTGPILMRLTKKGWYDARRLTRYDLSHKLAMPQAACPSTEIAAS